MTAQCLLCKKNVRNKTMSRSHYPKITPSWPHFMSVLSFQYSGAVGLVSRATVSLNGPFNATAFQLNRR